MKYHTIIILSFLSQGLLLQLYSCNIMTFFLLVVFQLYSQNLRIYFPPSVVLILILLCSWMLALILSVTSLPTELNMNHEWDHFKLKLRFEKGISHVVVSHLVLVVLWFFYYIICKLCFVLLCIFLYVCICVYSVLLECMYMYCFVI